MQINTQRVTNAIRSRNLPTKTSLLAALAALSAVSSFGTDTVPSTETALSITTDSDLPGARSGEDYYVELAASGGTEPYSWEIVDEENWPTWLYPENVTDNEYGPCISGWPSWLDADSSYSFTLRVTDAAGTSAEKAFYVYVLPRVSDLEWTGYPSEYDLLVEPGEAITFSVDAHSSYSIYYNWFMDGDWIFPEEETFWTYAPTEADIGIHSIECGIQEAADDGGWGECSWSVTVVRPDEPVWRWTGNADGASCTIGGGVLAGVVEIPEEIEGLVVTDIEQDAFAYCPHLTSLRVPDGVTNIGARAFSGCSNLETLFLPASFRGSTDALFIPGGCSVRFVIPASDAIATSGKPVKVSNGSDARWFAAEDATASDGLSLRSGQIETNATSTVSTTVSGPGRLSFDWKISAGRGDFCRFLLDGTTTNFITRSPNWRTATHDIGPGTHQLSWVFVRGTGTAAGENAAFLDNVAWRPEVSLVVSSGHGTPDPATGTTTLLYGDEVAASVSQPAAENGVRYVCAGWTGTGSVPAEGAGSSASFAITNDSTLVWNWRTNYWIDVTVTGGTTDFEPQWVAAGESALVEIVPDWHLFGYSLSGDRAGVTTVSGSTLALTVPADKPRNLRASLTERKLYLSVASDYGEAVPAPGYRYYSWNTEIEARVSQPAPADGYRHTCTGWTGTGDVPASGTGTNVAFAITRDSSIRWRWATDVWIDVETEGPVSADFSEGWIPQGEDLVVRWTPEVPYFHVRLSGDTNDVAFDVAARTISVPATRPRALSLRLDDFTLADALDTVGLAWTTDGDAEWFPQTSVSEDGEDAAQSGIVESGDGWSGLEATLDGPGTLSWSWRIDAEGTAGVDLIVDGEWLSNYVPGAEWSEQLLSLEGAGEHVVRFEFWNTGAGRADRAWIDRVFWTGRGPVGGMLRIGEVVQTNAMLTAICYAGDGAEPVARTIEIASDERFSRIVRSIPLAAITRTTIETVASGLLDDDTPYWVRMRLSPDGGETRISDAVPFRTPIHTAPRIGSPVVEPAQERARFRVPVEAFGSDGGIVAVSVVVTNDWTGETAAAAATLAEPGTAVLDVTGLVAGYPYRFAVRASSHEGVETVATGSFSTPEHTAAELEWIEVSDLEQHDAVVHTGVETLGSDGGPVAFSISIVDDSTYGTILSSNLVMRTPGMLRIPLSGLSAATKYRINTSARTPLYKWSERSRTFSTPENVPPAGTIDSVSPLALSAEVRLKLSALGDRYQNAVRGVIELSENEDFSDARNIAVADDWTEAGERSVRFEGLVPKQLYHVRSTFISEPDGASTTVAASFRTAWGEPPRFAGGPTDHGDLPALSFVESDHSAFLRIRIDNPILNLYYTVYTNENVMGTFHCHRSEAIDEWDIRNGYKLFSIPADDESLFVKVGASRGRVRPGSKFGEGEDTIWRIDFQPNGGEGKMEDLEIDGFDTQFSLPPCRFTNGDKFFLGWSRTANGPVEFKDGETVSDIRTGWWSSASLYAIWVDDLFATALDAEPLRFETGGDADWFVQEDEAHQGGSAMRSGAIAYGQSSWIETTVDGPGTLSFWWKVSSSSFYGSYDSVAVLVDGTEWGSISGTGGGWTEKTINISEPGSHTIRWKYLKNGGYAVGSDCAWLDAVTWTPLDVGPDPEWTTGTYSSFSPSPASSNLLRQSGVVYTGENAHEKEDGYWMDDPETLTDGYIDSGMTPEERSYRFAVTSGQTLSWSFPSPATVRELGVYNIWGDYGRDAIDISTVEVLVNGVWTIVSPGPVCCQDPSAGSYYSGHPGRPWAVLGRDGGLPLAERVTAIKIVWGSSSGESFVGVGEVEVIGSF